MRVTPHERPSVAPPRGHVAYERIKSDIFDFRLLPGDRFSEPEIAERFGMSRTPVREALLRLEREGYVTVAPTQRLAGAAAGLQGLR